MPIRRSYADHGDACAAAHALDVIGDRWAVIVVRELMLGPKRFSDLLAGALGATPSVLTARLRELEAAGVVEQIELPAPARVAAYQLTPWGVEFEPILQALGRWAQGSPTFPGDGDLTPDAAILAMRTMAGGPPPRTPLAFDLGLHDHRAVKPAQIWYRLSWGPGSFVAIKCTVQAQAADVVVCDSATWGRLLFAEHPARSLTSAGVTARGDGRQIAKRFLSHFHRSLGRIDPAGAHDV